MNCIFCHRPLPNVEEYVSCTPCKVSFAIENNTIVSLAYFITDRDDTLEGVYYIFMNIDPPATELHVYEGNGYPIISTDNLHWIFPSNVEEYIERFRKLIVFS